MSSTHDFSDSSRGTRLHKVLADAGVASRRASERLIAEGAVEVNGIPVTNIPAWVDPTTDRITVNGKRVAGATTRHVYVMLFKPRGVVCTNAPGERRAIDLVKHPSRTRLFPVGRLDLDSSGLLILTNDGELANRMTHPRYEISKCYEITVKGSLDAQEIQNLEKGIFMHDKKRGRGSKTRGVRIRLLKRDRQRTRLHVELREGRNRQVRRMTAAVGYPTLRLVRTRVGDWSLEALQPGQHRKLDVHMPALNRKTRPGNKTRRRK